MPNPNRLLALDILRGITIAGMILVNNPGSWGSIYAPLRHAAWHGLTPTDLVFPFFMFIMGISTYFSLRKYDFKWSGRSALKVVRRAVVIFLIGWCVGWFSLTLRGIANPDMTLWDIIVSYTGIRTLGVLPRLAICYAATALLALCLSRRAIAWVVGVLLVGYSALLLLGNGLVFSEDNIIAVVDRAVLGVDHMYADTIDGVRLKFDPEGLLSTLPSIAHCLIGFLCGGIILGTADTEKRSYRLFIVGFALTAAGFLLSYGMPINKKIWSPTFVLTTCGLAASLLGFLIWVIDIKGKRRWCTFFEVFGINPLFLYTLSAVLSILFGFIKVPMASAEAGAVSLHTFIYKYMLMPVCADDATLASLCFAICFVLLNWLAGLWLYKKKIYIKI